MHNEPTNETCLRAEVAELKKKIVELTVENERLRNRVNLYESGVSVSEVHVKLLEDTTTLAKYGAELGKRLLELEQELESYRASVVMHDSAVRECVEQAQASEFAADSADDATVA